MSDFEVLKCLKDCSIDAYASIVYIWKILFKPFPIKICIAYLGFTKLSLNYSVLKKGRFFFADFRDIISK